MVQSKFDLNSKELKVKDGVGSRSNSHEERGSDNEADREHKDRQGWVQGIGEGTGNGFRSLQKTNKMGTN